MTKLNEAQRELLLATAGQDGGSIAAPADRKIFAPLIKKGLLISVPMAGGGSSLTITELGRSAISEGALEAPGGELAELDAPAPPAPPESPKGKISILTTLLRRDEGATIEAMMTATGWQAHSVRGAISGSVKKALGLTVASAKVDGVRTYRIVEDAKA